MTIESKFLVGTVDIDSETAPTVERDRLYRLWEEGHWSAKGIDFSQDRLDWQTKTSDTQRKAFLWMYALFLDGEESVTVTLTPFVQASKRLEDRVFLATQIADEARHHVFFDRFLREVAGIGTDLASTLALLRPNLTWGYRQVFEELDRVADRLRVNPNSKILLAQGVTIYHLVIEAMLAHTGQHFIKEYGAKNALFPGFSSGINFTARDESRHIAFGIQLLRELTTNDPACKAASISMLNKVLPWAAGVFTPPAMDWSYVTELGFTPHEIFTFALRSVATKLKRAGIAPDEVLALVKLGHNTPPAAQADRTMTLIEGGIIGTDAPPRPTEPVLDAVFASVCDIATWTAKKHPAQGTIQWQFSDAEPRYLVLGEEDGPRVGRGTIASPRLTLQCSASDWALIAGGRLNQTLAVMTRRLRLTGDLRFALGLGGIIPV